VSETMDGEEEPTYMVANHRRPYPLRTCPRGSVRWRIQSPPGLSEQRGIRKSTCELEGQKGEEQNNVRTRLNLGHADGRIHYLAQEGAGERANGSLGGAVHAAARVRVSSRNRPNVDDVARVAGLEVFS
jgi:hypothetical protein